MLLGRIRGSVRRVGRFGEAGETRWTTSTTAGSAHERPTPRSGRERVRCSGCMKRLSALAKVPRSKPRARPSSPSRRRNARGRPHAP